MDEDSGHVRRYNDNVGPDTGISLEVPILPRKDTHDDDNTGILDKPLDDDQQRLGNTDDTTSQLLNHYQDDILDQEDVDKGWAWVVCFASFVVNFILDGVLFSFGVILLKLLEHFGESKSKTAWVGSALLGFSIAMGPVVSLLLEFYSCRQVMILGSLIASFGFVLSVFATNVETLIFTYGIIGGSGFGLSFVTAILAVGLHFNKKRALATGIAMSGSGMGTFAISYLTERLLEWYGLQGTMLILAGLVLNCCVCGALMRPLVKRKTTVFPCCPNPKESHCCWTEKYGTTIVVDEIPAQQQNCLSLSQTIAPTSMQWMGSQKQRLAADENKLRLFRSNEHVYSSAEISDRRYKSDFHLHNCKLLPQTQDQEKQMATKAALGLPLRRKDIFYSGSIYNLPEYRRDPNMKSFLISMVSLNSDEESCVTHHGHKHTPHDLDKTLSFVGAHKELFCDKLFLMLLFIMAAWTGQGSILTYLPDLAVSRNVSTTEAALLVSTVGASNIIGRLFAGWLTNKSNVDSVIVYTFAILLAGITSATFPFCSTFPAFIACSTIFGLCMAACVSLRTVVLADVLGVSKLTKSFGIVAFLQGVAFSVGAPISGALYDRTLSFLPPFILAASMYMFSGVTCALVRPVQRGLNCSIGRCCYCCCKSNSCEEVSTDDSHSTQSLSI